MGLMKTTYHKPISDDMRVTAKKLPRHELVSAPTSLARSGSDWLTKSSAIAFVHAATNSLLSLFTEGCWEPASLPQCVEVHDVGHRPWP